MKYKRGVPTKLDQNTTEEFLASFPRKTPRQVDGYSQIKPTAENYVNRLGRRHSSEDGVDRGESAERTIPVPNRENDRGPIFESERITPAKLISERFRFLASSLKGNEPEC